MLLRYSYNLLLYLLTPFVFLRLLWRSRKNPAYRQRWNERLGYFQCPDHLKNVIWVHAVSVGEVIAAVPLIRELQKKYLNHSIVVTTMTPTGSERVKKILGDSVFHVYVPYDLPTVVNRFYKKIQPKMLVLMETELWLNLLYYSYKNHIPVVLANARLSQRSFKGYRAFRFFTAKMFQYINFIAAQSEDDANRFKELGARLEKIKVVGNIKFDLQFSVDLFEKGQDLRKEIGSKRPVFIAASTHLGEDEKILRAFSIIRMRFRDCLLILVPRHPERQKDIVKLCRTYSYSVSLRSQNDFNDATDILVVDTLGELMLFYAASDVAFVGGSLVSHGGHNLLEPAMFQLPILSGPYLFNFSSIAQLLEKKRAFIIVRHEEQLADNVIKLFEKSELRKEMGARAKQVLDENKGSLERHLNIIQSLLT